MLCFYKKNMRRSSWSQWPRGLMRRAAVARLLGLWVRILPGAWMAVLCECCVLSGRGLYDEPITCPEESYRLWCVLVCVLETSWNHSPRWAAEKRKWTLLFNRRRVFNPPVFWCGNCSLTNCVCHDKFLFHERYVPYWKEARKHWGPQQWRKNFLFYYFFFARTFTESRLTVAGVCFMCVLTSVWCRR
jgi:hypothetical protein